MEKNKTIIPWKNVGQKPPGEVFKISWSWLKGKWVKDENGTMLGHYVTEEDGYKDA